ncbi:MAG TPA: hypothetical protein VK614_14050 [Allosphingosinicella sp.]|nr:hypothetical protein [Allosphingosinicella sp.]
MNRLVLAVLALLAGTPSAAQEPERPGQQDSISRALFAEGRLWLLSDAGLLYSVREGDDAARAEDAGEPVLDICLDAGRFTALTGRRGASGLWTLRRHGPGGWERLWPARADEDLIGLNCDQGRLVVVSGQRTSELMGDVVIETPLSAPIREGRVATMVHGTRDHLFVGLDAGEWGGGLRRIERRTGRTVTIERNSTGELCDGPLNTACDPVNAIVDDPWQPDCIVVAIGLVHMAPHGRLTRVCGARVERLYFRAYASGWGSNGRVGGDGEPFATVAFFGLIRSDDALLAIGIDGVHRVGRTSDGRVTPLPEFRAVGPFRVSFAIPGVALVLTSVNQRASLSGVVPLIVPR